MSHFGSSHNISNFSITIICVMVIFYVTILTVLWCHKTQPCKTANNCVCSDCSTNWLFPHLSPSPQVPYSLRHNSNEIRPINNPIMTSKCSSERVSHMSLTLNQKPEMIKLSEEGMSKAEAGQKLGLLYQLAELWMWRKSSWRKLKVVLQWTHK